MRTLAPERATLFIFLPRARALPSLRFGNHCLLCVQACGFMSGALNCGQCLCIFARSRSTGRVWECLRNKPAYVCVFFLIPLSLICTRLQQKKVAQTGQWWREMPQSFTLCLVATCVEQEGARSLSGTHGCTVNWSIRWELTPHQWNHFLPGYITKSC